MRLTLKQSLLIMAGLMLLPLVCVVYGQQLSQHMEGIRVWGWMDAAILLIAFPLLFLQRQAGLPDLVQPGISGRFRTWLPLATGMLFGLLDVIVIKMILHPEPYDTLPPFLQPFPYSIFLFGSGALEIEIFYRMLPITILLLLVGKFLLKGKHDTAIFWVVAVLTALREPLEQWQSGPIWFMFYAFITGFGMNLLQAVYYRRAGFLAALMVRFGHYLLWHILLGLYVEYVELAG